MRCKWDCRIVQVERYRVADLREAFPHLLVFFFIDSDTSVSPPFKDFEGSLKRV